MLKKKDIYFEDNGFTLAKGDCFLLLKKIEPKSIDFIFADPPYFLSSGGISCQSGKQVSVNKGEWDFSKTIEDRIKYHRKWISLCRNVLKDDGTIMISSTLHSVYAIGVALELEGFSIINNLIWKKLTPLLIYLVDVLPTQRKLYYGGENNLPSKRKENIILIIKL